MVSSSRGEDGQGDHSVACLELFGRPANARQEGGGAPGKARRTSICDDSDKIGQDCPSLWEEMMMEEDEGPTAQELEMADEMWDDTWEDE